MVSNITHTLKLLLTPTEAAQALAVSPRTLWTLTHDGKIQSLRIGRSVRYDPRDLEAFIQSQKS
jgi:excisionase family DNA binding protein